MFITTGDKGSGGLSKAKVYRSVDSSVPSILPPWFESQVQHQYFYQLGLVEKTKINKEARIGPFLKNDLGIAFMAKNSVLFFCHSGSRNWHASEVSTEMVENIFGHVIVALAFGGLIVNICALVRLLFKLESA